MTIDKWQKDKKHATRNTHISYCTSHILKTQKPMNIHTGERVALKNLTPEELEKFVTTFGEKPYRARQIMAWVYQHHAASFEAMTNLPHALRAQLAARFYLNCFTARQVTTSSDGTHKFLFTMHDGNCIESVLIPERKHLTICVSTQVGCALGCTFCLTGTRGLIRNLTASEIVSQICAIRKDFLLESDTVNIVFMGMGEPLANYENTRRAIYILTDPVGCNISHRRITVSTAGLIPEIRRLGDDLPVNLAISLNAATNTLRNALMPINKKYPLDELLAAASKAILPSRKRITFEYILMRNVNDSLEDARALASLLRGVRCKINLIPLNEHAATDFKSPDSTTVERFRSFLASRHFTALVRYSKGNDIAAACGQLGLGT
jgi:23S rRNA (adenine2503-C2)-methyltransferase